MKEASSKVHCQLRETMHIYRTSPSIDQRKQLEDLSLGSICNRTIQSGDEREHETTYLVNLIRAETNIHKAMLTYPSNTQIALPNHNEPQTSSIIAPDILNP